MDWSMAPSIWLTTIGTHGEFLYIYINWSLHDFFSTLEIVQYILKDGRNIFPEAFKGIEQIGVTGSTQMRWHIIVVSR
jgi:hypothetical protein